MTLPDPPGPILYGIGIHLIHSLTYLCVNVGLNFEQAVASNEWKEYAVDHKNRPDMIDARPKGVLFSTEGPTGWHHRRELGTYKEDRGWSEHDFSHLHGKFADPEDAA